LDIEVEGIRKKISVTPVDPKFLDTHVLLSHVDMNLFGYKLVRNLQQVVDEDHSDFNDVFRDVPEEEDLIIELGEFKVSDGFQAILEELHIAKTIADLKEASKIPVQTFSWSEMPLSIAPSYMPKLKAEQKKVLHRMVLRGW
jgi:hypothetical protein